MHEERAIYRKFVLSTSLIFLLSLTIIFTVVTATNRRLIFEQAKTQARALFSSIVMTRKWNAVHGGVYVEKKGRMISNPYLDKPDIITTDGRVFTLKNPALMTREISKLAEKEGLFQFHITSLKPLNPENKADAFETRALMLFEKGEKEAFERDQHGGKVFRYMAPLFVGEACLTCHAKQGYTVGQVRGGISVTIDIRDIKKIQDTYTYAFITFGCISISVLLGLVFFFTKQLTRQISKTRQQIETLAIEDELTGLFNRRHVLVRFAQEFERAQRLHKELGCMMIDLDHFKEINDTYGHLAGDKILKEASLLLTTSIRAYDIAGRYGGEEFLIVLPDTNFDNTLTLAERTRENIRENLYKRAEPLLPKPVTVSIGITSLAVGDTSIDDMLLRADDGLYKAKNDRRDRVAWIPPVS